MKLDNFIEGIHILRGYYDPDEGSSEVTISNYEDLILLDATDYAMQLADVETLVKKLGWIQIGWDYYVESDDELVAQYDRKLPWGAQ